MSQNALAPAFDFIAARKQVLAIEREDLAQLDQYINDDFRRACEALFRCTGKVVVMGMGKFGHIGRKLAVTFASTGTPAFFIHPGEASHGDLGMVSPQDIVIALSNSGESHEVLAQIPVLKRLHIPLLCMTGKAGQHHGESDGNSSLRGYAGRGLPARPGAYLQHHRCTGDGRRAGGSPAAGERIHRRRFRPVPSWRRM